RSTCTRTSISSEYFFLVAEASAISRAPKTMSRGTFFSLASTSTSITSSRFPATRFAATRSSQFGDQPRPLDVIERQRDRLSLELQTQPPFSRAAQHAHEPATAARVARTHSHVRLVPRKAREIARLVLRPVEARRGHF